MISYIEICTNAFSENQRQIDFILENENFEEKILDLIDPRLTLHLECHFGFHFSIKCWDEKDKLIYKYEPDGGEYLQLFTKWLDLSKIANFKSCHVEIGGYNGRFIGSGRSLADYLEERNGRIFADHFVEQVKISDFSAIDTEIKKLQVKFDDDIGASKRKKIRKKIIDLSLKYQILSSFTSLVLQAESGHAEANLLSSGFFDLSDFNKAIGPQPVDMSPQKNFVFQKTIFPLTPLNLLGSISLVKFQIHSDLLLKL